MNTLPPITDNPIIKFAKDNAAVLDVVANIDHLNIDASSIMVDGKGIDIVIRNVVDLQQPCVGFDF